MARGINYSGFPGPLVQGGPYWPWPSGGEDDQKKNEPGEKDEIARWHNHKFKVDAKSIRGFTGLQIKGHTETEDKVGGNQKFVSRKNSKPTEISLTAILDARLGCDVKTEALQFVSDAYNGCVDWFYLGSSKLATYKLMLTDATVKDIVLSAKGKWIIANVALTLKQCTQKNGSTAGVVERDSNDDDDSSGSHGGGSGGGGSKKKKKGGGDNNRPTGSQFPDSGTQRHRSRSEDDSSRDDARSAQEEIDKRKEQAQQGRTKDRI